MSVRAELLLGSSVAGRSWSLKLKAAVKEEDVSLRLWRSPVVGSSRAGNCNRKRATL